MAARIGARIKELREAAGITRERLAWDCDLDRAYVGHIEAGRRLPSLPVLQQIATRLGADLLDIAAAIAPDDRAALVYTPRPPLAQQATEQAPAPGADDDAAQL